MCTCKMGQGKSGRERHTHTKGSMYKSGRIGLKLNVFIIVKGLTHVDDTAFLTCDPLLTKIKIYTCKT